LFSLKITVGNSYNILLTQKKYKSSVSGFAFDKKTVYIRNSMENLSLEKFLF